EHVEKALHHREKAIDYLRRYLGLVPNDVEALIQYAELREKLVRTNSDRDRFGVLELYERILRQDPGQRDIRRKAIRVSMSLRRWADALDHIEAAGGSRDENMDGELFYWKGLCQKAAGKDSEKDGGKDSKKDTAQVSFKKAYERDPALIDSY